MMEFDVFFVPPVVRGQNENPNWNVPKVIREVIQDDREAETFIRFKMASYNHLLVAYRGEAILGFQVLDWDHHETCINLGSQALSAALSEAESAELGTGLRQLAKDAWELF